jgi:D-glycero-alpha-D-manno-heptose-7-phosphate kinase
MAAFGGLTCLTFEADGNVIVEPLKVNAELLDQFENNLLLFFTGKERKASDILRDQDTKSKQDDQSMIDNLLQVKDIGLETRKRLLKGDINCLGEMFHAHWKLKKERSHGISEPFIDECYEMAMKNGAAGGKLIGAGGGGFLMFYCCNANSDKLKLIGAMSKMGLKWERFRFDCEGAKILVNT